MVKGLALNILLLTLFTASVVTAETGPLQDPMRPVRYQVPAVESGAEKKAPAMPPQWRLTSVLIAEDRSVAVINGQSFQLGDVLSGYKLIKIEPVRVLLQKNKKQIVLRRSGTGLKRASSVRDAGKGNQP